MVFALAGLLAAGISAFAHPHVWVTMQGELVYAPDGSVTGVRYNWTFDDMFSAFATQGLDPKKPGCSRTTNWRRSPRRTWSSLKDFGYFTFAKANGSKVEMKDPTDYYLDYNTKDTVLTLHFSLPFKTPVKAKELNVEIYDPEYFIDFSFKDVKEPGRSGRRARGLQALGDPAAGFDGCAGSTIGRGVLQAAQLRQNWGAQFANKILVKCP